MTTAGKGDVSHASNNLVMSDFDDSQEHSTRRQYALLASLPTALLVSEAFSNNPGARFFAPSLWVSCLPFALAVMAVTYWVTPIKNHRLGTQGHGQPPRLLRPGNPVLRQSSGLAGLLLGLFLVSCAGCVGLVATSQGNDPLLETAVPMMYLSLAIFLVTAWSQAQWLELDVDTLRILRHRVTFGLQRTRLQSEQSVRALAACRTPNNAAYNVFVFTQDGTSLPVSQENNDLKQIQFEAERLADQLMVPLLVGVEEQNNVSLARILRGRADEALPIRRDWAATTSPGGLADQRSVFPPID